LAVVPWQAFSAPSAKGKQNLVVNSTAKEVEAGPVVTEDSMGCVEQPELRGRGLFVLPCETGNGARRSYFAWRNRAGERVESREAGQITSPKSKVQSPRGGNLSQRPSFAKTASGRAGCGGRRETQRRSERSKSQTPNPNALPASHWTQPFQGCARSTSRPQGSSVQAGLATLATLG
jgi:hypothetical protein